MSLLDPRMVRRAPLKRPRAVCCVVRGETLPECETEFAQRLSALAKQVLAEERACSSYVVTRQMGSPRHFAVHMRFEGWRAFNLHARTDHFEAALPGLTALLAQPVSLEVFLEV